jgi:hypothetical protein
LWTAVVSYSRACPMAARRSSSEDRPSDPVAPGLRLLGSEFRFLSVSGPDVDQARRARSAGTRGCAERRIPFARGPLAATGGGPS